MIENSQVSVNTLISGGGYYIILPSGDISGATDSANIMEAHNSNPSGSYVSLGLGKFYVDQSLRRFINPIYIQGKGKKLTTIEIVATTKGVGSGWGVSQLVNIQNIFEFYGNHWQLTDLTLDGNVIDPDIGHAVGDLTDSNRNCLRVVNSSNWRMHNLELKNAPFHGLIAVGSLSNFSITGVDAHHNGWRGMHCHAESGNANDSFIVSGNQLWQNGASPYHAFTAFAEVTAGSKVIQLTAEDFSRFPPSPLNQLITIEGAGAGGGTYHSLVTSFDKLAYTITCNNFIKTTIPKAQVYLEGDYGNSGLFCAFGAQRAIISNNIIRDEHGVGLHLSQYSDEYRTVVSKALASVQKYDLSTVYLDAVGYNALKTSAGTNLAGTYLQVESLGEGTSWKIFASFLTFKDSDKSIKISNPDNLPKNWGISLAATIYTTSPAVNTVLSNQLVAVNNIVSSCHTGVIFDGVSEGTLSATISKSKFYGAIVGGKNLSVDLNIKDSGIHNLILVSSTSAPIDTIGIRGSLDGSGASNISIKKSGSPVSTRRITLDASLVVKNGGNNPHYNQSDNMLGFRSGSGVQTSVGVNVFKSLATIVQNTNGAFELLDCSRVRISGDISDNSPAAGSGMGLGSTVIKLMGACTDVVVENSFIMADQRTNDYLILEAANTCSDVVFRFNKSNMNRAGSGGNVVVLGSGAGNRFYGNTFAAATTVSGGTGGMPTT